MKNLNNSYMVEMTPSEMQEINGGIWPILIKLGLTAALLIAGTQTAK
ncbi:class IIb bacteriocin, lactobin A/cerein 7B family [Segatella bryantii]|jgi:lactobin A/cerein 7B family class IIb bacteriocin|nr:class IIb bacteriocin, lactobin A/cerein 7B family [Segatella bryantii]